MTENYLSRVKVRITLLNSKKFLRINPRRKKQNLSKRKKIKSKIQKLRNFTSILLTT